MPDGDVKIHVSADADVKAIDDAAKKVEDLAKGRSQTASEANPRPAATPPPSTSVTAASYEALEKRREDLKALRREQQELERQGDTKAAQSTGRRADRLEKNIDREGTRLLRVEDEEAKRAAKAQADAEREKAAASKQLSAEERNAAKERQSSERAVSRELKEQHAMRRAGVTRAANVFQAGADVATSGNAASSMSGSFMQMGMASANPIALVAGIVASLAMGIKGVIDGERDKDTSQGMELREKSFGRTVRRSRNASVFGSSGAMVSSALDAEDEVANRKAARSGIDERAREKWYAPSTWTWFGLRKNEGQREGEKNEAEIADLEQQKEKDLAAARKKFITEEGGQELQALRGRSKRSLAGSREAMVAELGNDWISKYKSTMAASGDESLAKEMADLTVSNNLRDRQASAGAGLVDAKSGGAEIAAAARWATGSLPGMSEVAANISALHATVQQDNAQSKLVKMEK